MANHVVCTVKSWNEQEFKSLKQGDRENNWFLVSGKEDLTLDKLREIKPRYVFFPHWSWIIPDKILNEFECVVFHMTDLPYGRGGSPLQNLIVRGIYETKLSALRAEKGLDSGPIYMKLPLSIAEGSAEEIYKKAAKKVFEIIKRIVAEKPEPKPQIGKVVEFKRRKPEEGNMAQVKGLRQTYDFIRMLDAEGYPKAFIESNGLRYEFSNAKLKDGKLSAKAEITRGENNE